jgi:hypothetical protein
LTTVTTIRRYNRFWTEEGDRLLLELRAAGRSSVFIGAILKRSAHAIDKRLSTLKARAQLAEAFAVDPIAALGQVKNRKHLNRKHPANDDKSPLIDLITCIVCEVTMKIANSAPDAEGRDLVQYRCELCNRTERVLLFRRSLDAAA